MAKKKAKKKIAKKVPARKTAAKKKSPGTRTKAAAKKKARAKKAVPKKKAAPKRTTARKAAKTVARKKKAPARASRTAVKKKAATKKTKKKTRKRASSTLGRPRVPADAELDLVFRKDYKAREVFDFLGVTTVRELEKYGPDEIIRLLTGPMVQTVGRIRKAMALCNRSLAGDLEFAVEFKQQAMANSSESQ